MASTSYLTVAGRRAAATAVRTDAGCSRRAASSSAVAPLAFQPAAPTHARAPSSSQPSAPESSSSSSSSSTTLLRASPLPSGTLPAHLRPKLKKQPLHALRELRAALFEQTYNPAALRTGAKYLRKPLVGPRLVQYYPPQLALSEVRKFLLSPARLAAMVARDDGKAGAAAVGRRDAVAAFEVAETMLATPREIQRIEDVIRRKELGKGPPKKGEGRRAAMKNKSGKK